MTPSSLSPDEVIVGAICVPLSQKTSLSCSPGSAVTWMRASPPVTYSGRLDNTFMTSLPLLASCGDLAASGVTRPSASPLDEPPPQATSDKDAAATSAARGIRVENMVSLRHLWWPPSAFRAQWGMQARVQPNTLVMADRCSLRTR